MKMRHIAMLGIVSDHSAEHVLYFIDFSSKIILLVPFHQCNTPKKQQKKFVC